MEEIERIQEAVKGRQRKKIDTFVELHQAAKQFLAARVIPRQRKYGDVMEIWEEVLPQELSRHCEIVDISGGRLTVQVDSPAHKYELHLCSSDILRELQRRCRKASLTRIKLI